MNVGKTVADLALMSRPPVHFLTWLFLFLSLYHLHPALPPSFPTHAVHQKANIKPKQTMGKNLYYNIILTEYSASVRKAVR